MGRPGAVRSPQGMGGELVGQQGDLTDGVLGHAINIVSLQAEARKCQVMMIMTVRAILC